MKRYAVMAVLLILAISAQELAAGGRELLVSVALRRTLAPSALAA
jgi:hypothetical protein